MLRQYKNIVDHDLFGHGGTCVKVLGDDKV